MIFPKNFGKIQKNIRNDDSYVLYGAQLRANDPIFDQSCVAVCLEVLFSLSIQFFIFFRIKTVTLYKIFEQIFFLSVYRFVRSFGQIVRLAQFDSKHLGGKMPLEWKRNYPTKSMLARKDYTTSLQRDRKGSVKNECGLSF